MPFRCYVVSLALAAGEPACCHAKAGVDLGDWSGTRHGTQ